MRRVALIAMLTLAAVAATAVATGGDGDRPPTLAEGAELATTISQDAKDAAATLASARVDGDVIPNHLAEPLRRRAAFGANPELSRLAVAQASQSLYLVPGHDHVCLVLTNTEAGGWTIVCPTTQDLAAGRAGPMTVGLPGGALAVAGLVPDGIDTVHVRDGAAQTVPVENNTYYRVFADSETPKTLSYTGPDGPVTWKLANPHTLGQSEQ